MGKVTKNTAAEAVAVLTNSYDEAVSARKLLGAEATEEQIAEADELVSSTKTELDQAVASSDKKPATKQKQVKIKFLLSPCGKFKLPYNVDQVVLIGENQANELVDAKYAEFVK